MVSKQKEPKTIYYCDELHDEFSKAKIKTKIIDERYEYLGGNGRKAAHVFYYKIVARPLAFLYLKLHFGYKIIGREKLPKDKTQGYFIYGNHTNPVADALIPSMISYPVDQYVIVHPNNVSMPVLGRITPALGALPLPDDLQATRHFYKALQQRVQEGNAITIYPEAHIWPYYTGIRHFSEQSFGYPLQMNAPVYCFTNTYQRRKYSHTPRIVTYVDGPFTADALLPKKAQKLQLREMTYQTMKEKSGQSNVELVHYVKKEE